MKKTLNTIILMVMLHPAFSQVTDSVTEYSKELSKIQRAYMDSMRNNPRAVYLRERINALQAEQDNYFAFSIWTQILSSDHTKFNADNALSGFPAMSGPEIGFGIGISNKNNRRIFDMSFFTLGIPNKVTKADEKISTNFGSVFDLSWGYDLVKSRMVNIYPYAGIGLRITDISYSAPVQINPGYTNITNLIVNQRSFETSTSSITYQAGIGLEFALTPKNKHGGTILMIKAGTCRSFGKADYEFHDFTYDPKFKYGEWSISAGFKFFGRY